MQNVKDSPESKRRKKEDTPLNLIQSNCKEATIGCKADGSTYALGHLRNVPLYVLPSNVSTAKGKNIKINNQVNQAIKYCPDCKRKKNEDIPLHLIQSNPKEAIIGCKADGCTYVFGQLRNVPLYVLPNISTTKGRNIKIENQVNAGSSHALRTYSNTSKLVNAKNLLEQPAELIKTSGNKPTSRIALVKQKPSPNLPDLSLQNKQLQLGNSTITHETKSNLSEQKPVNASHVSVIKYQQKRELPKQNVSIAFIFEDGDIKLDFVVVNCNASSNAYVEQLLNSFHKMKATLRSKLTSNVGMEGQQQQKDWNSKLKTDANTSQMFGNEDAGNLKTNNEKPLLPEPLRSAILKTDSNLIHINGRFENFYRCFEHINKTLNKKSCEPFENQTVLNETQILKEEIKPNNNNSLENQIQNNEYYSKAGVSGLKQSAVGDNDKAVHKDAIEKEIKEQVVNKEDMKEQVMNEKIINEFTIRGQNITNTTGNFSLKVVIFHCNSSNNYKIINLITEMCKKSENPVTTEYSGQTSNSGKN